MAAISPSAADAAHGAIHGNPLITAINERDASKAPEIEAALADSIRSQFGDRPMRAKMQAIICSAVR